VEGYLWATEENFVGTSAPQPGEIVRLPDRGPPWLVVCHRPEAIITSNPGTLWLVEIVDPVSRAEQRAARSELVPGANYSRAVAVRVIEQLSRAILYGLHGDTVVAIIDRAARVTRHEAEALAQMRHAEAATANSSAWRRWLDQERLQSYPDISYDGTLAAGQGGAESAIGRGFMAIHDALTHRALSLEGNGVLAEDPDDPEGAYLTEPWAGAAAALGDAAFAFGAPELLSESERTSLSHGWLSVFGFSPTSSAS
jgi:hypothetical protein